MRIRTARFLLRDFLGSDRTAFVSYQMDARYRRLYDLDETHTEEANKLFDRFLSWQREQPRRNFQLGIFEPAAERLCGCAGLRRIETDDRHSVFGIELTPNDWGRYRMAVEVTSALIDFGFRDLGFDAISGSTASGNRRVDRLARWFGADIVAQRQGPSWMTARGWVEVDWRLSRDEWERSHRTARN